MHVMSMTINQEILKLKHFMCLSAFYANNDSLINDIGKLKYTVLVIMLSHLSPGLGPISLSLTRLLLYSAIR